MVLPERFWKSQWSQFCNIPPLLADCSRCHWIRKTLSRLGIHNGAGFNGSSLKNVFRCTQCKSNFNRFSIGINFLGGVQVCVSEGLVQILLGFVGDTEEQIESYFDNILSCFGGGNSHYILHHQREGKANGKERH